MVSADLFSSITDAISVFVTVSVVTTILDLIRSINISILYSLPNGFLSAVFSEIRHQVVCNFNSYAQHIFPYYDHWLLSVQVHHLSVALEKRVDKIKDDEKGNRDDLFILASSYIGKLKNHKNNLLSEAEYHKKDDRVSNALESRRDIIRQVEYNIIYV